MAEVELKINNLPWGPPLQWSGGDPVPRLRRRNLGHRLLNAEYSELPIAGRVDSGGCQYAYGFEDGRKDGVGPWAMAEARRA
jgi:hypothetical protein